MPSSRDLADPGIEPGFPALQAYSLPSEAPVDTIDTEHSHHYRSSGKQLCSKVFGGNGVCVQSIFEMSPLFTLLTPLGYTCVHCI